MRFVGSSPLSELLENVLFIGPFASLSLIVFVMFTIP